MPMVVSSQNSSTLLFLYCQVVKSLTIFDILKVLVILVAVLNLWSVLGDLLTSIDAVHHCKFLDRYHVLKLGINPWNRVLVNELLTNSPAIRIGLPLYIFFVGLV